MKNRTKYLSILAVLLIPFVAPWEGGRQTTGDSSAKGIIFAAPQNAASFMPVLDTGLEDLDARDAQNRPIKSISAASELRELFLTSLFSLAVAKDLHGIRQIWQDLALYSHLFRDLIFKVLYPLFRSIPLALQPSTKRFVHNVHNLWTTFFVGSCLSLLLFATIVLNPARKILFLRC